MENNKKESLYVQSGIIDYSKELPPPVTNDIIGDWSYYPNNIKKNPIILKIKKLDTNAKLPEKQSAGAAAFDIYALEDTVLPAFEVVKVRTGIAVEVPEGFKLEVYTRSGYAAKGINIVNQPGKIDSDYRGELFMLLRYLPTNLYKWRIESSDSKIYKISAGDRIAQIELQEVVPTEIVEVSELSETERGTGGLGSTGK